MKYTITPKSALKEWKSWKNCGWFKYYKIEGDRRLHLAIQRPIEDLSEFYGDPNVYVFVNFTFLL